MLGIIIINQLYIPVAASQATVTKEETTKADFTVG
jgi:hypothetical protein